MASTETLDNQNAQVRYQSPPLTHEKQRENKKQFEKLLDQFSFFKALMEILSKQNAERSRKKVLHVRRQHHKPSVV